MEMENVLPKGALFIRHPEDDLTEAHWGYQGGVDGDDGGINLAIHRVRHSEREGSVLSTAGWYFNKIIPIERRNNGK